MRPSRKTSPKAPLVARQRLAWLGLGVALLVGQTVHAQTVRCHLNYGGVNRTLSVAPTACPQSVWPQVEGNTLSFQVVNPAPSSGQRSVTIDTQTLQGETLQATHRAQYLGWETSATPTGLPYGFTGLQTVPNRQAGHALQYWCERLAETDPQPPTGTDCPAAR